MGKKTTSSEADKFLSPERCCVCGHKIKETEEVYEIPAKEEYHVDKPWGIHDVIIYAHPDCMYYSEADH